MEMVALQLQLLASASASPGADISSMPGADDVVRNALLEACLIHLRLLDDFLGGRPKGDDVSAQHWLPTWRPRRFLSRQQTVDINAQLAHLAARRQHWNFEWPVRTLAVACAGRFEEFFSELERACPQRALSLAKAHEFAEMMLGWEKAGSNTAA